MYKISSPSLKYNNLLHHDACRLIFQGGLLQVSYAGQSNSALDERVQWKRFYRAEFSQAAAKLPANKKHFDSSGCLIGADFSSAELDNITLAADARYQRFVAVNRRRGRISTFSKGSRRRLLRITARFRSDVSALFVTLTYRENMRDHKAAKKHLDYTLRWLKRRHSGAILWRMEYQKRGAIHFHLLLFGADYIEIAELTTYWQYVTGDDSYPDVERCDGRRKVLAYVSKYLAKVEAADDDNAQPARFSPDCADGGAAAGLDNETYSDPNGEPLSISPSAGAFVGRFWGVIRRDMLPFADAIKAVFHGDARVIAEFRRYARRHWRGMSKKVQGFTLFCNAARWFELFDWLTDDTWHWNIVTVRYVASRA